jgi:formylglycine-generating enzyme required for sulfatase activity/predicted Ser/Thr protein kinase
MSELPQFGRYPTLGVLGQGGMGVVYLSRHPELGWELAIKASRQDVDPAQRERFRREIRALCQLRHPSLVEIVDAGEERGVAWFAMRRVQGHSLEERLHTRGRLAAEDVIELGIQLCAGLRVAHEQGILHRDLKPANVLCTGGGRYVVTDFGLAKDVSLETSIRLSRTGTVQGTPGYWAPEQALGQGQSASERTDVYGVGAVLYAALTESPPITGDSVVELMVATREQPPTPPSSLTPVPAHLERVVLRCLEKAPQDRYPSLAALSEDLLAVEGGGRGINRVALGVGLAIALPLVALTALAWATLADSGTEALPPEPPSSVAEASPDSAPPEQPSATPAASPSPRSPAWYSELEAEGRAPLPLPEGISFGDAPLEYLNDKDRMILVWVGPGSFLMGDDEGPESGRPEHRVTFAEGFFIGKYEVTWRQLGIFCRTTGREVPSHVIDARGHGGRRFVARSNHPAFNVTWTEAEAYGRWAGLRLPSEAEWEYAARGPKSATWPWGEAAPGPTRLNLADKNARWRWTPELQGFHRLSKSPWRDGFPYTAPVGRYPEGASPFGCLDMAGNVFEWVQDAHAGSHAGAPVDGSARVGTGSPRRVCRGGSWYYSPEFCRGSSRLVDVAHGRSNGLGFRVARSAR